MIIDSLCPHFLSAEDHTRLSISLTVGKWPDLSTPFLLTVGKWPGFSMPVLLTVRKWAGLSKHFLLTYSRMIRYLQLEDSEVCLQIVSVFLHLDSNVPLQCSQVLWVVSTSITSFM